MKLSENCSHRAEGALSMRAPENIVEIRLSGNEESIVACRELVGTESHAIRTPLCDNPCFPGPIERFWALLSWEIRILSTRYGDQWRRKH